MKMQQEEELRGDAQKSPKTKPKISQTTADKTDREQREIFPMFL